MASALGICVDAFTESPQWPPKCGWTGDETRPREGDLVTLLPVASEGQCLSNCRVQPSFGSIGLCPLHGVIPTGYFYLAFRVDI